MADTVVRLKPRFYVHIQDNNSNITTLLCGPTTYTVPQHQALIFAEPKEFVSVPPGSYAIIENPVDRDAKTKEPLRDQFGQIKTLLGEREVRFEQPPFPLYPGEILIESRALTVLTANQALLLRALRKFTDATGALRNAGDEYMFRGPGTYVPRVEEEMTERRDATVVKFNEALKLRAKNMHVDCTGVKRQVGEEYLWIKTGTYMIGVDETLVAVVPTVTLTQQKAVHVEVTKSFIDERLWAKGVQRRPGQVYLVTFKETSEFTPHPAERIVTETPLITVNKKQWAVILDPVENGVQQLGRRKVVSNTVMYLQPGERLEAGVRDVYVLSEDEALLLTAIEEFTDNDVAPAAKRVAGELWLLQGPREYCPNASIRVMKDKKGSEKRSRIVLPDGEGVYVRNTQTGEVRAVIGTTFMLAATEELWEKDVPAVVEDKLARQGNSHTAYMDKSGAGGYKRDKTKVIKYMLPNNSVCQVYDYKKRTQRTVIGPDAVLLGPEEQFTVLSLSGSEWDPKQPMKCLPKKTGMIQSLYLYLGPASMSDVVTVETLDHARLSLQLSYDWYFEVEPGNESQLNECFKIPDFVGDCCSCVASRVRASIASIPFDTFHKHSNKLVTTAVFGGKPLLRFPSNRLVVTSVDIQEIEVVDEKTREALQQSVKMAIEITTQSQEAVARQEASEREQVAKGKLERQQIEDRSASEVERKKMLQYETRSAAIASTGRAKAEAKARAEASEISGDSAVSCAKVKARTSGIMDQAKLVQQQQKDEQELSYRGLSNSMEVLKAKQLTEIESSKFGKVIDAIGRDTVTALARAGPEMQARMLKGLGLEGYLVTDGTNPINLFNTAKGMTATK